MTVVPAPRVDRNGLEVLDRDECLRLLAGASVGRLAYTRGGAIAVVPVNIALAGGHVLFRLSTGAALTAVYAGQFLTLEVDDIDAGACCGWSLNVIGLPAEVPAALAVAEGVALRSWLRPDRARLFRLATDHVEGRRLPPARPAP